MNRRYYLYNLNIYILKKTFINKSHNKRTESAAIALQNEPNFIQFFWNIIIIWLHMLIMNLISSQALSYSSPSFPFPPSPLILANNSKQVAFSVDVKRLSSATELDIVPQWQRTVSATVALSVSLCCCTSVFLSVSTVCICIYARARIFCQMRWRCVAKTSKNCAKQLILFQTSS